MEPKQSVDPDTPAAGVQKAETARKLDAFGWGLFFLWLGTAWLADLGLGVGLVGVGVITLGMQATRRWFALRLEAFWVVVGLMFTLGGVWNLVEVGAKLAPVLSIIAGVLLIGSLLLPRSERRRLTQS